MRRLSPSIMVSSVMLVLAVVLVTYGASFGSHSSSLIDRIVLSTTLEHEDDTYLVRGVGAIHYGTPGAGVATPEAESPEAEATPPDGEGHVLRLMRVMLYPEVNPQATVGDGGHPHEGDFILTVETGAVCYSVAALLSDNAAVIVQVNPALSGQPPVHPDCGTANIVGDCYSEDGCVMDPTDGESVIYLPAGSVVVQTGIVHHWYGNIDPVEAVVYVAAYHHEGDSAGCSGGCW